MWCVCIEDMEWDFGRWAEMLCWLDGGICLWSSFLGVWGFVIGSVWIFRCCYYHFLLYGARK